MKTSLSEENGESFYEHLENADEIQRLIKFILDKEITRFNENELESDEFLKQKCCNIYVLRIAFVVVLLFLLFLFCFGIPLESSLHVNGLLKFLYSILVLD